MTRCSFLVAFLVLLGCTGGTASAQDAPLRLDSLLIKEADLPTGCLPRALDEGAPPFLKTNPQVSDEPEFSRPLGDMAFRGKVPTEGIEEALMGVYQGDHEVGMLAFRFRDAAAAREAGDVARANEEAQEILLQGTLLALIWRDGPSDACFEALTAHARRAMGIE